MANMNSRKALTHEAKMAHFEDKKERGWPSPSCDLKAPSPPLKSLWISVVRRPTQGGPEAHQKCTKMRPNKA